MRSFRGANIAILQARMGDELANLIRRNGGDPYCVPSVREVPLSCEKEVSIFLDHLAQSLLSTVVFLTGSGVTALLQEAEKLRRSAELLEGLRAVTNVCRGPKPAAVLRRNNLPVSLSAKEPYTTPELLEAMTVLDIAGRGIALVHYGERNEVLTQALQDRGAHVEELCLYEWLLPEDVGSLQTLVQNIIGEHMDAVVFTSQIQVRHLFLVATNLNLADELVRALNTRTIVASIGPTCTAVLQSFGVAPHVIPEHPKMGHLVKSLVEYMK